MTRDLNKENFYWDGGALEIWNIPSFRLFISLFSILLQNSCQAEEHTWVNTERFLSHTPSLQLRWRTPGALKQPLRHSSFFRCQRCWAWRLTEIHLTSGHCPTRQQNICSEPFPAYCTSSKHFESCQTLQPDSTSLQVLRNFSHCACQKTCPGLLILWWSFLGFQISRNTLSTAHIAQNKRRTYRDAWKRNWWKRLPALLMSFVNYM